VLLEAERPSGVRRHDFIDAVAVEESAVEGEDARSSNGT